MKYLALMLALLLAAPALAQTKDRNVDDGTFKDSVYYTMDDGIMDKEEMQAEAQDMYGVCSLNAYQRTYINCECLAGAFLLRREKEGPMIPQAIIYEDIIKNRSGSNCANTASVAGVSYQQCMDHSASFRELARDNEEYCTCVGNKVARDFTRRPVLQGGYISTLDLQAMRFCRDPANRPPVHKSATTNP